MSNSSNFHHQIPLMNRLTASTLFMAKHLWPASSMLEKWRKRNIQKISTVLREQGKILNVARVNQLSKEEFVNNFLKKGIPVIFNQEAIDWSCCHKWDFSFFKSNFCDDVFSIIDSSGLNEPELLKNNQSRELIRKDLSGKDFIDAIEQGTPLYMRFCPILETHPHLREDLNLSWLSIMKECFLGVSYQTFIGAKGRRTPLHSETTAFFYVMVSGRKKWNLYSPAALSLLNPIPEGRGYNYTHFKTNQSQQEQYPSAEKLHRYTCEIEKGDILFVPTWMWHEVENIENSWGVSYRFTNLRGFLKYPALAFIRFFLTKPSFFEVFYYSFFKSDVGKRNKNPLTPKLFLRDKK